MRTLCGFLCAAALATGADAQFVGIDFEHSPNGLFSPTNWNVLVGTDLIVPDLIDESGSPTGWEFVGSLGSSFGTQINPAMIPQHGQPLDGLDDYYFGSTGSEGNFIFQNLQPNADYNIWVFGLRGFPMNNRVTIFGGSGQSIEFTQITTASTGTGNGTLFVNGEEGSSSRTLDSYAVTIESTAGGNITVRLRDDAGPANGWTLAGIAIEPANAAACPADLNADGVVDADDFFLFLQLFANADPRADINGDGVIDADDFFAYLTLFAQGC